MVKLQVLCVAVAGLATAVVPATADPITISSGALTVSGFARGAFRSIDFSLTGGGPFGISGELLDGPSQPSLPPCTQFAACTAGATTNPTNTYSGSGAFGSATVNGTFHPEVLYRGNNTFTFTGGDVVLPATTADTFELQSPFLFQGATSLWAIDASNTTAFLGDFLLTGRGTATTKLQRSGAGYAISGFTYAFSQPPSPTPEPGSMLLLGTGLAAVWRARRGRRTAGEARES